MHSDGKVSMSGIYKSGAMYGGMAAVVDLQGRPLTQHQCWLDFAWQLKKKKKKEENKNNDRNYGTAQYE